MECAVCGQQGAFVGTAVDDNGDPVGEWIHPHCAPQHKDIAIEITRLGTSRYRSFSGRKTLTVQRMWPRVSVVFQLAKPRRL